ncbi:unnamed protein product [Penicillium camemberti]|uniref:Str. FM013 n=1 Tax=Penicillium camemberti (strain FM 013) TaxID=1429867 RepID=A0A0G4PUZ6_PENC3|nr:unnamed protein product [Penicillium camemberti]
MTRAGRGKGEEKPRKLVGHSALISNTEESPVSPSRP